MAGLESDSAVHSQQQADPETGEPEVAQGRTPWSARFSRRTVLRVTGLTALAAAAGSLIGARGGAASTPTPRRAVPQTRAQATAEATAGPSVVSSGDTITIGFVTPLTGPLAGFASGDQFIVNTIQATDAYKNGFTVGGKNYAINLVVKDSQSDPNRAGQVAQDLINSDKVDLILTTSTPETTNPVATIAEQNKTPCLSTVVPWQAWYFGRQADPANPVPFKYTTMFFFGAESFGGCFIPMWDRIPTNKVVAGQFPNDADGNAFRAYWPDAITAAGYTFVDGGAYTDGTTDFTQMISQFKQADAQVFINAPLPPDFNTFWQQAAQQGWKPKIATVAKVLLFPADTEALGDLVINVATDCWWGPFMPYKSSIDGTTSKQLADAYTAATSQQWTQSLGSTYSLFEIAQLALQAASDPHDHDDVAAQLFKVNYSGIVGPLDFTTGPAPAPGAPTIPGIGIIRPLGVQWVKGQSFPYEMVVVDNSLNKDVPVSADLQPTNP
jgi:branched-chain amino acid transport system substrate-binding protein